MEMDFFNASVYVGTYSKYNRGSLFGAWLILSDYSDKDEFLEACRQLHSDEQDPEFMFQDYENIPKELISESWISEKFFFFRDEMNDWDDTKIEAFSTFLNYEYMDDEDEFDEIIQDFEDRFVGEFNSEKDFAYSEAETLDMPYSVEMYFDYDAYASDLFINSYSFYDGFVFYKKRA